MLEDVMEVAEVLKMKLVDSLENEVVIVALLAVVVVELQRLILLHQ
jgi:hypothetical protein